MNRLVNKMKSIIKRNTVPMVYCHIDTVFEGEQLENEVIVVTGGGSGIGKAVACKAISEKARVIIVGRREDVLKEVSEELGIDYCKYYVCDVAKINEEISFFDELEKVYNSKVTALVNNAGIYINKGMLEFTEKDFDDIISVNLKAPMFLTMKFVEYCKQNGIKGNVVVTASNRGLFGDYGPYGVSKRGIIHYVEGVARELIGTGIRINAVAPGMTASEINGIDKAGNMYTPYAKGKRVLLPEEIAEVICFLLSNRSRCINGATIPCDEGDFLR